MPLYESTFIARQDLSKQDVTRLTDTFTAIVEKSGGKVVKSEYWGLRNLAYRINKNRKGHYTMLGIDAPYDAVKEMERNIRISEEVLRAMTIRVETLDSNPSAMMNARTGRDDERAEGEDNGESTDSAETEN